MSLLLKVSLLSLQTPFPAHRQRLSPAEYWTYIPKTPFPPKLTSLPFSWTFWVCEWLLWLAAPRVRMVQLSTLIPQNCRCLFWEGGMYICVFPPHAVHCGAAGIHRNSWGSSEGCMLLELRDSRDVSGKQNPKCMGTFNISCWPCMLAVGNVLTWAGDFLQLCRMNFESDLVLQFPCPWNPQVPCELCCQVCSGEGWGWT